MDELASILEEGIDVKFELVPKRVGGPGTPQRRWEGRFTWSAEINGRSVDCEWEGFTSAHECINDFIMAFNSGKLKE